jgi:hypothetical protein
MFRSLQQRLSAYAKTWASFNLRAGFLTGYAKTW